MPKNKRPVPRKSSESADNKDELLSQTLCDLALALAEQEDGDLLSAQLRQQEADFQKLLRKALQQKKDEVLYDAIERAKDADVGAYQYLRGHIEELAATVHLRRPDLPAQEIDAFAIPLFVHSDGGLRAADEFQDQQAFDALVASMREAQLESPDAQVVLIRHAYDLNEIDNITFSQLNDMVREAYASMTEKKIAATPALERSLAGWTPGQFGPDDRAVELRFLLGFSLKRADDPFYRVPHSEAEADAYFATRMERYRQWTERVPALVARCLVADGRAVDLNFLYQDLFYGAKEQGLSEYFMLQMLATLRQALERRHLSPAQARAVVAPADTHGEMVLRVQLYDADGQPLAAADKPLDLGAELALEVDDICDALSTLGLGALAVAMRFDAHGHALDAQPYQART